MPDLGALGAGHLLVLSWIAWNPHIAIILVWKNCFPSLSMNLLDDEALFVTASDYKNIYK